MIRIKFQCEKCGREWEYDIEELKSSSYFPKAKFLKARFQDYEVKCECGHIVGSED